MSAEHHPPPTLSTRRDRLFLVLAAFFIGNALLAELIGGKLFAVPIRLPWQAAGADPWHTFVLSCGIILWPVVFLASDLVNEYYGRVGVKRLSFIAAGVIAYAFVALFVAEKPTAVDFSPVDNASFRTVFIQSQWIIVGSIAAFLLAQLIDVTVFWIVRRRTGHRYLWLRATGSTVVSQLVDTLVVQFIGLHLPYLLGGNGINFEQFVNSASSGYLFKLMVAIAITPLLYIVHALIDAYLGKDAKAIVEEVAQREGAGERE